MLQTYEVRMWEQGDTRSWGEVPVSFDVFLHEYQLEEEARFLIRDRGVGSVRFNVKGSIFGRYFGGLPYLQADETIDGTEDETESPGMLDNFERLFWDCVCGHSWGSCDEQTIITRGDTRKTIRVCSTCGGKQTIWLIGDEIIRVLFDCKVTK